MEVIELEYIEIFEKTIKVLVPIGFQDMDELLATAKYPSAMRPQIIMTNRDGTVNFMFNRMNIDVQEKQLSALAAMIKSNLMKINSGIIFEEQGEIIEDEIHVVWMKYNNPTLEGRVHNMMSLMKRDKDIIQAIYSCDAREKGQWDRAMLKSVKSIRSIVHE